MQVQMSAKGGYDYNLQLARNVGTVDVQRSHSDIRYA